MFDPFMKISQFLWHWRWWFVAFTGLLVFLMMNSAEITVDSGLVSEADQTVRYNFAIVFAGLAAQLVAWFIGVLHAIELRRFKWLIGILFLPPVVFVYLFISNQEYSRHSL
ncbi:MAG: hypothetical protein JAY90_20475 [Candidatus Thiodiazotropha lotti]|nr:hypothetical protein [Candidatus Thiodiazotropha lotti]